MSSVLLDLSVSICKMGKCQKSAWGFVHGLHAVKRTLRSLGPSLKTMALHPCLRSPGPFSSASLPAGRHLHDHPSSVFAFAHLFPSPPPPSPSPLRSSLCRSLSRGLTTEIRILVATTSQDFRKKRPEGHKDEKKEFVSLSLA